MEYKRPAGVYPLLDFHKSCRICTSFQDALAVKVSLDLFRGYEVMGVSSRRGLVTPKFSVPAATSITVHHTQLHVVSYNSHLISHGICTFHKSNYAFSL